MYRIKYSRLNFLTIGAVAAITILLSIAIPSSLQGQEGLAQNSSNVTSTNNNSNTTGNAIDSFRAQGQISSLASDTLAGREDNSTENVIWVLGGDWELYVAEGNLTNFVVDIEMTQVDGTAAHKHTIEKLNNATGMPIGSVEPLELNFMTGEPSSKIALVNSNSTMFRGTADLTTNEDIGWTGVPIHVTLQNGNILNINIDPSKTEDHFKGLPVFGTVQSIVDENGKELVKK
ncbi:MAG: hypothetical protein L0H55_10400 [Candidatus Nitrosocosmicus sp.]|nr:hypothetical protein [Candidatus Nitrosocosmicus sp.]